MKILTYPFPIFTSNPKQFHPPPIKQQTPNFIPTRPYRSCTVSIRPPPPDFDFKSELLSHSRDAIADMHPELLDLADDGSLVLIRKSQFGPVPLWRTEFVEPEAIWLIGTNHISGESVTDVDRVVRSVKPDNVVVELCRSRAGIMYTSTDSELGQKSRSNAFSLTGSGFFGAVGRSINLGKFRDTFYLIFQPWDIHNYCSSLSFIGGQTALALRLLLAALSSKISSDVNRSFGDEFRAARKASEEVGAQIVLGDRPIEITLERAWSSLKWSEKLGLVISVLRGISSSSNLSERSLKESSTRDSNFQLYKQLSFSYPSLLPPLIHERDTYLAWSLKRSKAVNNGKRVVGVIGKGHMNGVIYALVSDLGDLRFRDLVGERGSSSNSSNNSYGWIDTLVKNLVRDTVIGVILWALYEQVTNGL